jgi:hypothetical protein
VSDAVARRRRGRIISGSCAEGSSGELQTP